MEYWEFLLQQEGDHSWLPLDTAQMEILEGRYRIMAHTSQANTPVQVQISQRLLDQDPPKRRSLRRQGQTNDDGLMVVMPFTRLRAGTWDIYCSSSFDPTEGGAELPPEPPWAYSIQLQVLPPGSGDDDDWVLPDSLEQPTGAAPVANVDGAGLAPLPVSSPQSPRWQPFGEPIDLERVANALDQAQIDLATVDGMPGWLHRLDLSQTALSGHEGTAIELSGQVTGATSGEPCTEMALGVRLTDPQTAQVLALQPFSLPTSTLPTGFSLSVEIPGNLSTRLLLGELALVSLADGAVDVLALQRFTVTVDLSSLFDAIANRGETDAALSVEFPGESSNPAAAQRHREAEAWANIDLPQGPPRSVPTLTLPRSGFNLPPKIYYPSPHEVSARRPTLPPFGESKVRPRSNEVATPAAEVSSNVSPSLDATVEEADATPFPASPESGATTAPSPDSPRPALSLPPLAQPRPTQPEVRLEAEATTTVPLLPSHESAGFRDLKMQERFWTRLNDLAVTIQQDALQKRQEESPAPGVSPVGEALPTDWEAPVAFAGEVVIYEDEDETLGSLPQPPRAALPLDAEDETEPLVPPVPGLEIPSGDLVAGETVLLTLRVPFHPNRMYLKVWVTDPQSRSLVDEPRQVMHLWPNGQGQLEGSLQLTVPLGCLEAQFEAIAVDMVTQQESYKTTVSRVIQPAGFAPTEPEDFDL